MNAARVASDGRITVPVHVRKGLSLKIGDRLAFIEMAPGRHEAVALNLPVTALKGIVPRPRSPVSIAAMKAATRGHCARKG